ncbi:hypothetical protein evm_011665 [Chilo suppressalis]|nr:hypothetical protein evm_011665 [Chilo suppressalis]
MTLRALGASFETYGYEWNFLPTFNVDIKSTILNTLDTTPRTKSWLKPVQKCHCKKRIRENLIRTYCYFVVNISEYSAPTTRTTSPWQASPPS